MTYKKKGVCTETSPDVPWDSVATTNTVYVNAIFKNHETQLKKIKNLLDFKFNPSPFAKLPICAKSPDRHPGEKKNNIQREINE